MSAPEVGFEDVVVGEGREAGPDDNVTIVFSAALTDGTVVESEATLSFVLDMGEVIEGLDRGVTGMREGGVRRLVLPPELAYAERGAENVPPGATLQLEVKLTSVD